MDSDGWLSTRNKKKVQKPPQRLKKTRSSTLKPVKSSLQITHSLPPKELFTATKQSSMTDYFTPNAEPQLEVEVIFDNESQILNLDNADNNNCLRSSSSITVNEVLSEKSKKNDSRFEEVNNEDSCENRTSVDKDLDNLHNKTDAIVDPKTKIQIETEEVFHCNEKGGENIGSHYCRSASPDSIVIESNQFNVRRPMKRLQCCEDSVINTENPLKRARLDYHLISNNDNLYDKNSETSVNVSENGKSRKVQRDIHNSTKYTSDHMETLDHRNGSNSSNINLQSSCLYNDSLDLGSPLSLNSHGGPELSLLDTTELESPNDELRSAIQNDDLRGSSLTFTCEIDSSDAIAKDGDYNDKLIETFTLTDSQDDAQLKNPSITLKTKDEAISNTLNTDIFTLTDSQEVCTSDTLTSTDSPDITAEDHVTDTEGIWNNTPDLPKTPSDSSQLTLSFSSTGPESQSLDLS